MKTMIEKEEEANFQEAVEYDLHEILIRLSKLEKEYKKMKEFLIKTYGYPIGDMD